MAPFCLIKPLADKFLQLIRSGQLDLEKLATLSSAERRDVFAKFLGEENAKDVNVLYESKLLLKDQQQAMINFIRESSGLKEPAKRDLVNKINKMDKVLSETDMNLFLEDLAEKRLGVSVTMEEANALAKQAKLVSEAEMEMNSNARRGTLETQTPQEKTYGDERVKMGQMLNSFAEKSADVKISDYIKNPVSGALEIAGASKSLKSTLDNSGLFRQNLKVLTTHPTIWAKNAVLSFKDIADTFRGKDVVAAVQADAVSRPNYKEYISEKVAVGSIEEAFPQGPIMRWVEKIPGVGKIHKASNNAFAAMAMRNRMDLYDFYSDLAKKSGQEKTTGLGLGQLVNSLTGRGSLGKLEAAADVVNVVMFSPRFLKSQLDFLTMHTLRAPGEKAVSTFVRKQAAINLVKTVGSIALVLTIADALNPGSVEKDPRSSDFGKIKIGNTRFDVSGGMASLLTLAMRIATGESKSSTSGRVTKLNSGKYGAPTKVDVLQTFFENKLSPTARLFNDVLKGKDFSGNKVTVGSAAKDLFTPLPVENFLETSKDPKAADMLLIMIADGVGIGTNTYGTK